MTREAIANPGGLTVGGGAALPGVDVPGRGPVYGRTWAVAADHPTASVVALSILQKGGNAIDAVIAASAVNAVTKPYATHIGGDAFTLIWRKGDGVVDCLNAGGRAPLQATREQFPDGIPVRGPRSCSVPGLVDSWLEMYVRYATMPLATLLGPAIELCEQGFPTSRRLSAGMATLHDSTEPHEEALRRAFLKDGRRPYAPGETFRQPELAALLFRIVEDEREGFYGGETGRLMAAGFREFGGLIDEADFEKPTAHWHEPHVSTYNGVQVYEQALPSQGIMLLEALNIVERFPLAEWGPLSADSVHVIIEATKLAAADVHRYGADPEVVSVPIEALLSKEHAARRAAEIDLARAIHHAPALLATDTTQFVVADEEMAVSFIQSVFMPWGSRFVIPGTGMLMNNRLYGFNTDASHPNCVAPGKRTRHTLNTFLAFQDGRLVLGGGTPGGETQIPSNLQTIVANLTWGLDLQTAIDSPRWALTGDGVAMESRFPAQLRAELSARGHAINEVGAWAHNSRTQVMSQVPDGGWAVASDLRGEGVAIAV